MRRPKKGKKERGGQGGRKKGREGKDTPKRLLPRILLFPSGEEMRRNEEGKGGRREGRKGSWVN